MATIFEQMKAEKLAKERYETAAHRILGMSITEYLRYKNPSTLKELNKVIEEMALEDRTEIVKVYLKDTVSFVGVKLYIKKARHKFHPPGKEYIPVGNDYTLKNSKTILIDTKYKSS
jgi:hypothetical protein